MLNFDIIADFWNDLEIIFSVDLKVVSCGAAVHAKWNPAWKASKWWHICWTFPEHYKLCVQSLLVKNEITHFCKSTYTIKGHGLTPPHSCQEVLLNILMISKRGEMAERVQSVCAECCVATLLKLHACWWKIKAHSCADKKSIAKKLPNVSRRFSLIWGLHSAL